MLCPAASHSRTCAGSMRRSGAQPSGISHVFMSPSKSATRYVSPRNPWRAIGAMAFRCKFSNPSSNVRTTLRASFRSIVNASEPGEEETAPHAVAAAAADLAAALDASAIVAFTSSGTTAARIARKRPKVSILAVTPDQRVSRQLCLLWGAHSVLSKDVNTYEEMVDRATKTALAEEFAQPADLIVVVAGIPFGEAGTTNNLRVVQIGRAA